MKMHLFFLNGLAPVKVGGQQGFINKEQEIIIKFEYDYVDAFYDID